MKESSGFDKNKQISVFKTSFTHEEIIKEIKLSKNTILTKRKE